MKIVFTSQGVAVEMDSSMADDLDDLKVMLTSRLKSDTHKEFLERVAKHLNKVRVPCATCKANKGVAIDAQKERDELLAQVAALTEDVKKPKPKAKKKNANK